jgi:chitodextrinase
MPEPEKSKEPEEKEEDTAREGGPSKQPSPKVIIIASIIVLILIVGAIYFIFFYGKDLESLAVGNIDEDMDKIEFSIYATPSGFGEYSGDVTVEVYYEDQDDPLYTNKVKINDGTGFEEIPYEEFVWDNGEYLIKVKGEGKVSTSTLIINNVVTSIQVDWKEIYPDSDSDIAEYFVEVEISYLFGERNFPSAANPQGYSFQGNIEDPLGTDISLTSSLRSIEKVIEHTIKGTYTLSGSVTNTFCKDGSPYKTVSVVSNTTYAYDAAPFSDAGEDITITLSGGEALVSFDGSGSLDDGDIISYEWNFGDNSTAETTTQPTSQHTYTAAGKYFVTLKVIDDSEQESMNGLAATMVVTVTDS